MADQVMPRVSTMDHARHSTMKDVDRANALVRHVRDVRERLLTLQKQNTTLKLENNQLRTENNQLKKENVELFSEYKKAKSILNGIWVLL